MKLDFGLNLSKINWKILKTMVFVKRKPGESVKSLITRFSSLTLKSGVLIEHQKRMRHQKSLSKREKKEKAIRRLAKKKEAQEAS